MNLKEAKKTLLDFIRCAEEEFGKVKYTSTSMNVDDGDIEAIATILQELEILSGIEALIKVFPVDSMPENTKYILITKENFLNNPNYQQLLKDYISKDKIRKLIKELQEAHDSTDIERLWEVYIHQIKILEELLEK